MIRKLLVYRIIFALALITVSCNGLSHEGCKPKKIKEFKFSLKRPASAYSNFTADEFRIKTVYTERFKRVPNFPTVVEEYIKPGFSFWMKVMKPKVPTVGTLRLARSCITSSFYWINENGVDQQYCEDQCLGVAECQGYAVPTEYMDDCRYVENNKEAIRRDGGVGVNNTDFLVFVDFTQDGCGETTVAFAGSCQQNAETDRPEIAYINYCPSSVEFIPEKKSSLNSTTIHELGHALGFSSSLYAYMRDANGNPRTKRSQNGNTPNLGRIDDIRIPDDNTLDSRKKLWKTTAGSQNKTVYMMKTETLVKTAQKYFRCNELTGVDLENNEGDTLIGSHWEKSLLMDEVMMATTGKGYVSEFTLAFMQDTGWYDVDMSAAENLPWGKKKGCTFATTNCATYLQRQKKKGKPPTPWCSEVQEYCQPDGTYCNLRKMTDVLPPDLTYFNKIKDVPKNETNLYAGTDQYMDYCPYIKTC